jgi:hypothetical protein
MESSGDNTSRIASPNYAWAVLFGVLMVVGLAYLTGESLRDWDFYYRLTMAAAGNDPIDLRGESSAWLTRVIYSHAWALYVPAFVLAVTLIFVPRKKPSSAAMLSVVAALITITIGYLAAYLPVAKPDWWWTGRPEELIEVAKRHADFDRAAGEREIEKRRETQPEK